MSIFDPRTWRLRPQLGYPSGSDVKPSITGFLVFTIAYFSIYILSRFWLGQVTKYVPEPYLDEFFHIPQAQGYCAGDYLSWDQKITTPPGLYAFSTLFSKLFKRGGCTVQDLRAGGSIALYALFYVAVWCRRLIVDGQLTRLRQPAWDAIHTAVNVALFPPLFFFSGLYYTDVLSTCLVVVSYYQFLKSKSNPGTPTAGLAAYIAGVIALFMRQTNIFWVAVFLAGLEWVRACKGLSSSTTRQQRKLPKESTGIQDIVTAYAHGNIHDPLLNAAGVTDLIWCALGLGVAAIFNPVLAVKRLWPYVGLLGSFGVFVLWNGGVVLGDKSNHVATIHLAQMLYLWPCMMFFSAPLVYPYAIAILRVLLAMVQGNGGKQRSHKPVSRIQTPISVITVGWLLLSLAVALVVVHYNTIIHPFTLADNRHFVFYAFRYTIRQHPLVKYFLAPVYVLCGWLAFYCLSGAPPSRLGSPSSSSPAIAKAMEPGSARARKVKSQTTETEKVDEGMDGVKEPKGPNTSFALIWLIATILSLITAPLVEPRYFIIPWVIWRLHVPSIPLQQIKEKDQTGLKYWAYQGHDHRLWLETIWFLVINAVTAYVFLFKGFEWPQEPGKVQRFMW